MTARRTLGLIAIGLLIAASLGSAGPRLLTRVRPSVARAPADVEIQASVEPDAANRALVISADSAGFYRSSTLQVDGDQAARIHTVRFVHLPAGDYRVRVLLLGAGGERLASTLDLVHVW